MVADSSYKVMLRVWRFSFEQLHAEVGSNTLKLRVRRFRELMDAAEQKLDQALLAEFAPPRLGVRGQWPWSAADLAEWLRPGDGGGDGLRVVHLAVVTDRLATFTFRG